MVSIWDISFKEYEAWVSLPLSLILMALFIPFLVVVNMEIVRMFGEKQIKSII